MTQFKPILNIVLIILIGLATFPIYLKYFDVGLVELSKSSDEQSLSASKTIVEANKLTTVVASTGSKKMKKTQIFKPFLTENLGNYESESVMSRTGPGENGDALDLSGLDKDSIEAVVAEYGYNNLASDIISLDRQIKDFRPKECMHWNYPTNLPKASVIIVFYDEGLSTLLRTVHSVINTSPPELLDEVILVDDYNTKPEFNRDLEDHIKQFGDKVKLIRNEKHEGLIMGRHIGIANVKSDVFVILDAHCECEENWLPPLLTQIALNRTTLATPMIDKIVWDTYEHLPVLENTNYAGIFEWGLLYKIMVDADYPKKVRLHQSEPYWSPTFAGGLFAMDRKWFHELGGYDLGIQFWGGEQYELSFKVWQCGGQIEQVPCSRVGHIYKQPRYGILRNPLSPHQHLKNNKRVVEVYMDEYKEYVYRREPQIQKLNFGNISGQVELRNRLKCQSFKWYMENIGFKILKYYPLPPENKFWGQCANKLYNVCLNNIGANQPLGLHACESQSSSQLMRLNIEGELSNGEFCMKSTQDVVMTTGCIVNGVWNPSGEWFYDEEKSLIISKSQNKCLETNGYEQWLSDCELNQKGQQWQWTEVYIEE